MMTGHPAIGAYMRRLETLGARNDHIGRFYVALHDEELRDWEEQLNEANEGLALYQPTLDLYRRWRAEMGPEKWSEVWAHNESLGDADKNWLVSEAMDASLVAH